MLGMFHNAESTSKPDPAFPCDLRLHLPWGHLLLRYLLRLPVARCLYLPARFFSSPTIVAHVLRRHRTVPPPNFQALQAKAVKHFPKHPAIKSLPVLQNKHFVMWSLVAGATGMFLGAGMGGIRGNEQLRDIYDRRTGGSLTEQQVRYL